MEAWTRTGLDAQADLAGAPKGWRSGREQFLLLAVELLGGDDAAVAQIGQLRQLVRRAGRRASRGLLHIVAEGLVLMLGLTHRALMHRATADDEIHEDPDERDDQDKKEPESLRPAGQVMAAEDVDEDPDHDPDPDHPEEKLQDRPENVQDRIAR